MAFIYTATEFENIDEESLLVVFDTNVLLDLYRLPEETLEHLIDQFGEKLELFWIPKQVYIEYLRNSERNRNSQINLCKELKTKVMQNLTNLEGNVNKVFSNEGKYKSEKFKDFKITLKEDLSTLRSNMKKNLKEIEDELNKSNTIVSKDFDIINNFVKAIKADTSFSQLELIDIYEEGEKRYKYDIPPGFTDKSKNDIDKYGDLIIWKEILRKVNGTQCNVIFLQNEKKEDWWSGKERNQIPDVLKEEFNNATLAESNLYMMNFDEFLNHFALMLDINGTSIDKIMNMRNFISKIYNYIDSTKDTLIKDYIENQQYETLSEHIENSIIGKSIIGGSIDEIEDFEINNINITNSSIYREYEREYLNYTIYGTIEVSISGTANEYINKGYREYNKFTGKAYADIELFLSVDITSESIIDTENLMTVLEYQDMNIENIRNISVYGEFIYDDYIEEYNDNVGDLICPDCGKYYNLTNDGGNGFCIDCAHKH